MPPALDGWSVAVQVLNTEDLVDSSEVDWFFPIDPDTWRTEMMQTTRLGRAFSRQFAWCLEAVGIAPKGTSKVSGFLEKGADGLCEGGRKGIFTPMYLCVARKPQSNVTSSIPVVQNGQV
jgi:sterol 24-C-methyltransferase